MAGGFRVKTAEKCVEPYHSRGDFSGKKQCFFAFLRIRHACHIANAMLFCDRFRPFASAETETDRGIGLDRFDVEKTTFDFLKKMYGAPADNCSGPENRDASILGGEHIANAMIFSTVFDRFRAPRSIEASASVDSASKKRRSIS